MDGGKYIGRIGQADLTSVCEKIRTSTRLQFLDDIRVEYGIGVLVLDPINKNDIDIPSGDITLYKKRRTAIRRASAKLLKELVDNPGVDSYDMDSVDQYVDLRSKKFVETEDNVKPLGALALELLIDAQSLRDGHKPDRINMIVDNIHKTVRMPIMVDSRFNYTPAWAKPVYKQKAIKWDKIKDIYATKKKS